ncbi:MAG: hypothetical protein D6728_16070 [Cyanobacteria bacterium J055]|nr:MAG: hypothetical protein D6728_16070 [Cyanobacteria bacterium J055]
MKTGDGALNLPSRPQPLLPPPSVPRHLLYLGKPQDRNGSPKRREVRGSFAVFLKGEGEPEGHLEIWKKQSATSKVG